ncbi:MAG: T9SS C-terminal target domain-containing protein [Candidatus Zixiibacteriota bacterium]|nr:MAG: T9SS C-terminal target domain-containing protein [candidate division Zixibacteria bacterium]
MSRWLILCLALAVFAAAAHADHITVSGNVSGVWEVDTVFVAGEIQVPAGQALTIQPGVKVLFLNYFPFHIYQGSTFLAMGNASDSIIFKPSIPTGYWGGLRFQNSSPCSLRYCHLERGKAIFTSPYYLGGGIYCEATQLTLQNSSIVNCQAISINTSFIQVRGGGIYATGSMLELHQCRIQACLAEVIGNNCSAYGGAIYSDGSSLTLEDCNIIQNSCMAFGTPAFGGGSIHGYNSSVVLNRNFLDDSSVNIIYGIFRCTNCVMENSSSGLSVYTEEPSFVTGCIFKNNYRAIIQEGGNLTIADNLITENPINTYYPAIHINNYYPCYSQIHDNILCHHVNSMSSGGGLAITGQGLGDIQVRRNVFMDNTGSGVGGGGLYLNLANSVLVGNLFARNATYYNGGAVNTLTYSGTRVISNSTMVSNTATVGGAVAGTGTSSLLVHQCVEYYNSQPAYYSDSGSDYSITYSDGQTPWPGLGNISIYPAFVDTARDDYRLLWGSPCIDSGHPDSLDPDGTRADMGAFFFDQSVPMRVLLTPHQIPYLIPQTGGTMTYTARVDNWSDIPRTATVWCDVTLPDSSTFGPLLGPLTVTVPAHTILARERVQAIPTVAPMGVYHYNAYAVVEGDTSRDSFMFGKLGPVASEADIPAGNWSNTGDPFAGPVAMEPQIGFPDQFTLHPAHPNPFNPTTVARYEMRDASHVSLRVYDTAGREVATLVDGWRNAGAHEVRFDGSGLPSGIYFVRLSAGEGTAVQKVVLLK